MRFKARILGKAFLMLAAAAVLGLLVMLLWNEVAAAAFTGVRPVDYLHALGLLLLSRILFGSFRGRRGWHRRRQWEKWQAMTPQEREQFRGRMDLGRHGGSRE